jgi:hypothetical protein
MAVRRVATRDYPSLVAVIDQYLPEARLKTIERKQRFSSRNMSGAGRASQMHLFDLLRDRRLFPANSDLADFGARVLPKMYGFRFDKMARADIASRIIEYLETIPTHRRQKLEASMRDALAKGTKRTSDRKSFFSTWEQIIKNIEL